jgi:uncharacterized protein (AIM24 family)
MENKYSISEFLTSTKQDDSKNSFFALENDKILEVNLHSDGPLVYAQLGSMVAYKGSINFTKQSSLEHGLGKFFKRKLTGENAVFMKAEGEGQLYLAQHAQQIIILKLEDQAVSVNGRDLLAFEPTLEYDITMLKSTSALMTGGLFNVKVSGTGYIAITSDGKPLTLRVEPDQPVYVDPNSAIGWSSSLDVSFKTDVNFNTIIGRGSGESIQMEFRGEGFVVVQPSEGFPSMVA